MARTLPPLRSFFVLVLQLVQQPCAWCAEEAAVSSLCGLATHCWDSAAALAAANSGGGIVAAAALPCSGQVPYSTRSVTDEYSLIHISAEVVRGPRNVRDLLNRTLKWKAGIKPRWNRTGKSSGERKHAKGEVQAGPSLHPPPLSRSRRNQSNRMGEGLLRELEDTGLVSEEAAKEAKKAAKKVKGWWRRVLKALRDVDEEPSAAEGILGRNGSYKRHRGQIPDALVWKRVVRTKRLSAWYVAHRVKKMMPAEVGYLAFFESAGFVDWACFLGAFVFFCRLHVMLLALPATRGSHSWALLVWMMAGGVYNGIIWTRLGMDAARSWLTGYWLEFIFSMENVFIFHVVASGFRMSWAHSQKALIIVICFQICFQMVFYMGLAELLTSIWALPYLLGAWLVYVGLSTLKDDHSDSDHLPSKESQKPLTPAEGSYVSVAPFLSGYVRCFSTVLGERFECGYGEGPPSFLELNGKTKATLLVPALAALLAVDFIMEIDVTLTKIMEIQHGFIAFTSSVAAAFAVPDLFFVAQDLLSEFRLLKYGVSFVLVFFGTLLLLHQVVNLNDMVCIGIIMSMMGLCAYLSWLIPPPIQQQTDDISPTQRGRPEDLGFVDGCPEVTPSDCEEDMSQTHGPSLKQHPQSDGDAK